MATGQKSRTKDGLVQNPGQVGNALANVLSMEGGRETVLGQAWLAAPGKLITCGHVVERYVNAPSLLMLRFPASGNKYQVLRVRLHPSYVRQPDQLVKFDVALLELNLQMPEAAAQPLPFSYEQSFTNNQTLWAIRYPAHLGQLSAAPQPLTQDGRYLGPLRIHDTFHLLHDLPLSPGDSGAPISDGQSIVALHCGDTATLPGLNLPTTSIRLALWVDALRELGIVETVRGGADSRGGSILPAFICFAVFALISAFGAYTYFSSQIKQSWSYSNPGLMPVKVSLNEPVDSYQDKEDVVITLTPSSPSYLFCFQIDGSGYVCVLYPQFGIESERLLKGESRIINKFGSKKLTASPETDGKLYVLAINADNNRAEEWSRSVIKKEDWPPQAQEGRPLLLKGPDLIKRINDMKAEAPDDFLFVNFTGPHSK